MFLLVDNYDSFTYNLAALFKKLGCELTILKNDQFVDCEKFEGIILSPGPSSPVNSGTTLKYISKYIGLKPIFGVCLGMQAIGFSLGFKIRHSKTVMHGKVDQINIKSHNCLFKGIKSLKAVRYHSLAVDIPKEHRYVSAIAKSDSEIMAIEDVSKGFFAVQFHPESFLSEYGDKIGKNFIDFCKMKNLEGRDGK